MKSHIRPMQFETLAGQKAALNQSYYQSRKQRRTFARVSLESELHNTRWELQECRTLLGEMCTRNTRLLDDNFRLQEELAIIQHRNMEVLPDVYRLRASSLHDSSCSGHAGEGRRRKRWPIMTAERKGSRHRWSHAD